MTFCTVVEKRKTFKLYSIVSQSSVVCPTEKPELSFYMWQKHRCKILELSWRQLACTTQFKTQLTAQCTLHREDEYER